MINSEISNLILDTNVLLDILVFDDERAHPLRAALENSLFKAVATPKTIEEFVDVISRAQFNLSEEQQLAVLDQWKQWSSLVDDASLLTAPWKCKDRDDQVFINLAFTLKPSTLISKDKQVLKIAKRAQKEGILITSDHEAFLKQEN